VSSLYQRKSDGMWIGTIQAGWTARGTRKRITVSSRDRATAKRKLRDKQLEVDRGNTSPISGKATVKAWATEWLGIEERRLRPSSYNATRVAVNKWIVPTIGHKRFDHLTPADIRAVANAQRDAGRSSSTQRRTHSVLTTLLKAATAEGYPVPPRLLVIERPAPSVSDRAALTAPQLAAVLDHAQDRADWSRWVAALVLGLRQAEALGLTWDEVDLNRGLISVSWQLQPLPYKVKRDRKSGFRVPDGYESRHIRGALHLVRPKSRSGARPVPIEPWLAADLAAWRQVAPTSPHDLVWPAPDGGPRLAKDDDVAWYGLQKLAGVEHPAGRPYYIHEARHTASTLLMEAGVDESVRVAILGHSSITTTRGYQHVRTEQALGALGKVTKRLELG
jgi:integrase